MEMHKEKTEASRKTSPGHINSYIMNNKIQNNI